MKFVRMTLLRRLVSLSGWFLGLFGVGCLQEDPTAYGCPVYDFNLTVQGRVLSSADSSAAEGIIVEIVQEEPVWFPGAGQSGEDGSYAATLNTPSPELLPDSHLVRAWDPDGAVHGWYQDREVVIYAPYIGSETTIDLDIYLEPRESR